ncbi:MAG: MotA/TolQ/ExbB proton channel family protein [Hyphomonadaceae bacterium]|nr:MotA/TolQ/ExbB proton channel family protein [Hyphomonadaceae bacterium]
MSSIVLALAVQGIGNVETESAFSMVDLLLRADIIVQIVLIILLLASVWSWAVIVEKLFTLGGARKKALDYEEAFWSGRMDEIEARPGVGDNSAARVFNSISREWNEVRRGVDIRTDISALVERAERSMRAAVDREVGRQASGLGVLATVGSVSVFIGLFGTVWGIMNAFINIGEQQDTSLATVAGPIAEALFATGLGLVAAIPAVVFYNKFSADLNRFADQLDTFSQDVLVRLSRKATETQGQ